MKYYIIHEQTGELICTIFERICQHPTHAYNHCHNCPLIEEYNNHRGIKRRIKKMKTIIYYCISCGKEVIKEDTKENREFAADFICYDCRILTDIKVEIEGYPCNDDPKSK